MKNKKNKGQKKQEKKNIIDKDYIDKEYTQITSKVKENIFLVCIFILVFLMVFFQYKYEYKESLGLNNVNEKQYYSVLGLEEGSSLEEVRASYKKLVRVWHPDKHINCKSCKEKFNQITEAYEYIMKTFEEGDKRSIFENSPIILNINNYHRLVDSSKDFWLIFVYKGKKIDYTTQKTASVYNEINKQLKGTIKFGVIDINKSEQLLIFLPYKFPILPAIYTYDGRNGFNEIFQGIDYVNEINLFNFIQNCYSSSIELLGLSQINNFVDKVNKEKEYDGKNENINKNIDLNLFIISSKHFVDLTAKDFQRRYENEITIYQNDLGTYDDTIKQFSEIDKENEKYRIFVSYNKLNQNNKLKRVINPINIEIDYREKTNKQLIKSYEIVKKLMIPKIHRSNFLTHCKSKFENIKYKGDNELDEIREKSDICIIELIDGNNLFYNKEQKNNDDKKLDEIINTYLFESVLRNFEIENEETKNKNNSFININYGTANLNENKKLNEFIIEFEKKKNGKEDLSDLKDNIYTKRFLVVDINNHQFLLKKYNKNNIVKLKEFLDHVKTEEALEDMSLGYEYFTEYIELEETSFLFNEIKIFSIKNIISKSIYCQSKPKYLIVWILVFFTFLFIFKNSLSDSFSSTIKMVIFSIVIHIIIYGYNSYKENI